MRYISTQTLREIVTQPIPPAVLEYERVRVTAIDFDTSHIIVEVSDTDVCVLHAQSDLLKQYYETSATLKDVTRIAVHKPELQYTGHQCIGYFHQEHSECIECDIKWICETVSKQPMRTITKQCFVQQLLRSGMCTRDVIIRATCTRFKDTTYSHALSALRRARATLRAEGFREIKRERKYLWWVHES